MVTKQASGTASLTHDTAFPIGLRLLSLLRSLAHGEQEEFPVEDADHISTERAFPICCKGHMASADDTESFKNPSAFKPKRDGSLRPPLLPPPSSSGPQSPTACHVFQKPSFTAVAPSDLSLFCFFGNSDVSAE